MKQLQFDNYEDFACDIADKFESMSHNYKDVSIISKYDDAKEIIKELIFLEYDVVLVDLNEEYYDEYIISLNQDGIWCEKFKKDTGYTTNGSDVTYIMNDCSSNVIKHCIGDIVYEVNVGFDGYDECDDPDGIDYTEDNYEDDYKNNEYDSYTVNGHAVDKNTFLRYVSKFAPDLAKELARDNLQKDHTDECTSEDFYELFFDAMIDMMERSSQVLDSIDMFMNALYSF